MSGILVPRDLDRRLLDVLNYPRSILDDNFSLELPLTDLFEPVIWYKPAVKALRRKKRPSTEYGERGFSAVNNDETKFEVNIDCSHFDPKELEVKLVDDSLVITGRHEEKEDEHGFIKRKFTRRYLLPKDVITNKVSSSLTSDGVLHVVAPKKQAKAIASKEKAIPIKIVESKKSEKNKELGINDE